MNIDPLSLLMLPLVFAGVIVIITTINVLRMRHPERMLVPLPDGEAVLAAQPSYTAADAWARANGFQWAGAFRFSNILVLGWQHPLQERFFCIYSTGVVTVCEFISGFEDDTRLTTSNMRDSFFLPSRPGVFKQAFLNRSYEAIWKIHCETEVYLHEAGGRRVARRTLSFAQSLINSMVRQMKYVRSLPLWPLRSVWWYCVNRYTKPNRPAREVYSMLRS
ncbi:MAG: hypothetical protein RL514_57 [Verrucomicrobiota bacterium]|jgi:hypothetical protein